MQITLKDVLALPVFANAQTRLAGPAKRTAVDNIMVMEGHDVEAWLTPNELVLTSLITYSEATAVEFAELFKRLKALKCAGLIVKLGRYVDELPQRLAELAAHIGLALIIVDSQVHYHQIMSEVMALLFDETNHQLRNYHTANQTFIGLLNANAATQVLLDRLGEMTNATVTIVPSIFRTIEAPKGTTVTNETLRQLPVNALRSRDYYQHDYQIGTKHYHEFLTQLDVHGAPDQYLCITKTEEALAANDYIFIETATTLISLQLNIKVNIRNAKSTQISDAIDFLLSDTALDAETLPSLLEERHFTATQPFRVVALEMSSAQSGRKGFLNRHPAIRDALIKRLHTTFPKSFYRLWPSRLLFFLPIEQTNAHLQRTLHQIGQDTLGAVPPSYGIRIAYSQAVPFTAFKAAAEELWRVLALSRVLFEDQRMSLVTRDDLGIYQLLDLNHLDETQLRRVIPERLLTMAQQAPELVTTLSTYLDHGLNITRSAEALYIHPKTMRYRLNKIRDTYDLSLSGGTVLGSLAVGIRLLKLL